MSAASDPTSVMALLQVGDWWTYDGRGALLQAGDRRALVGTVHITVEMRAAGGRPWHALVFEPDWHIVDDEGGASAYPIPAGLFYFEQNPRTREVCIGGDNMGPGGSDRFARTPQVFYPGRFDLDTAYDNVLDFEPHGTVANRLRTVSIETVHTPRGDYATWKAPIVSVSDIFGRVEGVDYWRPVLGAPLRFEMCATLPGGAELTTQAVLRASNRSLE
ncbi:MAG: hypothetical protein JWQ11_2304 [Rhizobacter sp.]|nr:hypothetical protein [Rhizobacter sp.]